MERGWQGREGWWRTWGGHARGEEHEGWADGGGANVLEEREVAAVSQGRQDHRQRRRRERREAARRGTRQAAVRRNLDRPWAREGLRHGGTYMNSFNVGSSASAAAISVGACLPSLFRFES